MAKRPATKKEPTEQEQYEFAVRQARRQIQQVLPEHVKKPSLPSRFIAKYRRFRQGKLQPNGEPWPEPDGSWLKNLTRYQRKCRNEGIALMTPAAPTRWQNKSFGVTSNYRDWDIKEFEAAHG